MQIKVFNMQIIIGGGGRMQIHYMQVAQGLRKWLKIIEEFEMVMCQGLFHIVSILNGHVPLCGEHEVFQLAHTSWWVNKFMCHWILFNFKFYMVLILRN
jgi:hypothetical protein